MKKFFVMSIVFIILINMTSIVFAGDVPEGLLSEDSAKVFIGTVENYITNEIPSAPYKKIDIVEVEATKKIKGDVELGVVHKYTNCQSLLNLQSGVEYLFGYLDENNFYVYEIKFSNGNRYELVGADEDDMTQRLENYLNEGLFDKMENERLKRIESAKHINSSNSIYNNEDNTIDELDKSNYILVIVISSILVVGMVMLLILSKKR